MAHKKKLNSKYFISSKTRTILPIIRANSILNQGVRYRNSRKSNCNSRTRVQFPGEVQNCCQNTANYKSYIWHERVYSPWDWNEVKMIRPWSLQKKMSKFWSVEGFESKWKVALEYMKEYFSFNRPFFHILLTHIYSNSH